MSINGLFMAMIKRILNLFIKYDYPKDIQRQFGNGLPNRPIVSRKMKH